MTSSADLASIPSSLSIAAFKPSTPPKTSKIFLKFQNLPNFQRINKNSRSIQNAGLELSYRLAVFFLHSNDHVVFLSEIENLDFFKNKENVPINGMF